MRAIGCLLLRVVYEGRHPPAGVRLNLYGPVKSWHILCAGMV